MWCRSGRTLCWVSVPRRKATPGCGNLRELIVNVSGECQSTEMNSQTDSNNFAVQIRDNSDSPDLDSKLWRYISFEAALRTLLFNKLRFTRVALFEDEWEMRRGQKSQENIEEVNKAISNHAQVPHMPWPFRFFEDYFRNTNFVSSWTRVSPEHMTMWLAYTKSYSSVAIESSLRKLSDFDTRGLDFATVGQVEYSDIDEKENISRDDRELLFLKRKCFSFEEETRVSIQLSDHTDDSGKLLDTFEIDIPQGTINRVIAHPKMDSQTFELLRYLVFQIDQDVEVAMPKISQKPSD